MEVRAIAYPKAGVPRVLQGTTAATNGEYSLFLNANANGTLPNLTRYVSPTGSDTTGDGTVASPFKSIYKAGMSIQSAGGTADNGTIYLLPGDYMWADVGNAWTYPTNSYGWLTVTAAPGVDRSSVRITSSPNNDRLSTHLVHVQNVTLTASIGQLDHNTPAIWYDGCAVTGSGRDDGLVLNGWAGGGYVTDCTISNVQNGTRFMTLVRNTTATRLGEDAFSSSQMVVNCTASDLDPTGVAGAPHPDVIQNAGATFNNIWYGVTAIDRIFGQGLSDGGDTDMAIVGCEIATTGHQFYMDARSGNGLLRHFYMKDCVFAGTGGFSWSLPGDFLPRTTCIDVVVEGAWLDLRGRFRCSTPSVRTQGSSTGSSRRYPKPLARLLPFPPISHSCHCS